MGISIGMYTPNENEKEGEVRAIYGPVLSSRFTLSVYSDPYILSLPLTTNCVCYLCLFEKLPCYLVLSALATVLTSFLDCFPSVVTSLSSASFIPVTSCISSIYFLLGRPLLLLPSPYASIILFSNLSDRMTCPS